jgi:hypothetical protein
MSEFSTDLPRARIASLKLKARCAYTLFNRAAEGYDCGKELAKHINPNLALKAQEYNDAMTELRRLDPKCPEFTPL